MVSPQDGQQRVMYNAGVRRTLLFGHSYFNDFISGLSQASLVAQLAKNLPAIWETWVWSLGWEDPLEKGKATHSSILGLPWWFKQHRICLQYGKPGFDPWVGKIPWRRESLPTTLVFWTGEFHGLYGPWGHKESDMTEWLSLTHCNILRYKYWFTPILKCWVKVYAFWRSWLCYTLPWAFFLKFFLLRELCQIFKRQRQSIFPFISTLE